MKNFSINQMMICFVLLLLITSYLFITGSKIDINKYEIEECNKTIFEYDLIEYYNSDIDEFKGSVLSQNDTINGKLLNDCFFEMKDSIYLERVDRFFIEKKLNFKTIKFIQSYVCQSKTNANTEYHECMPIFRDLLIFKKQSKIVGIIKICFECDFANFVSAEHSSLNFNTDELEILEQFLIE